jgi:hypothetical protein
MSDPVSDLKRELLAAAERQLGGAPVSAGRGWIRGHHVRNRVILAAASLAIAAAVALIFTAPWTDSPGFLAKAQAALTPPAGTVLHYRWDMTSTSTDPACSVTRGPNEVWIDQTPPYRFRALLHGFPPDVSTNPRVEVCSSGMAYELGGTLEPDCTATGCEPNLRFVPPNTLKVPLLTFHIPADPVTMLREMISAGHAHHEGNTELDGRTLERIRIDPPPKCSSPDCEPEPVYAYVDPETFYPIRVEGPGAINPPGGPLLKFHVVDRYLTFEYLPRTATNLALTDIRAQHPNATETGPFGP